MTEACPETAFNALAFWPVFISWALLLAVVHFGDKEKK